MPVRLPSRTVQDCPVVGQPVILSRDRVFLDYIVLSESQPTCSNIHNCLSRYGDVKNIKECLLHNALNYLATEDNLQ